MDLEGVQALLNSLTGVPAAAAEVIKAFGDIIDKSSNANDNFTRTSAVITDMNSQIAKIAPTLTFVTAGLLNAGKMFDKFKNDGSAAINTVSDQFKEFIETTNDVGELTKQALSLAIDPKDFKSIDALKNEIIKVGNNFLQSASNAQQFQTSLLHLLSNTGQLSEVMKDGKISTESLDERMIAFNSHLAEVAVATGFSREQVTGFALELGKIPGALDAAIHFGKDNERTLKGLDVATRLATASGQNFSTVTDTLTKAYDSLNISGREAAEFYSYIGEAATKLGMRFDDVKTYALGIGESLKYVGNEGEGSLRVLNRYSDALRATGLSASASKELISGMVNSVGNLTTGTKAFLSARSGGPGGLQGAFQIDKLLKEGKIDEVTKMLETNLKKQLGGKIVSLDQAASSPGAAAQYQKQLSLVQSGAFGGLAKDDKTAKKLLDALASGNVGAAGELLESSKSLENTVSSATELQKQQNTQLAQTNAYLSELVGIASAQSKGTVQNLFSGAGTGPVAKKVNETSKIASDKSAASGKYKTLAAGQVDAVTNVAETIGGALSFKDQVKKSLDNLLKDAKKIETPTNANNASAPRSTLPKPKIGLNVQKENLLPAAMDFGKAVDRAKLPSSASLTKNHEGFAPRPSPTGINPDNRLGPPQPINITVEAMCIKCGTNEIKKTVTAGLGSIQKSVTNPGGTI